jgi:5-(carboxyamino)imidazole ribonucleotide synthase
MDSKNSYPFDKRIGIVGGGQLGKMLIEASASWNIKCNILESDIKAPAVRHSWQYIQGKLTDGYSIRSLAEISDVLTYEIEHIDVDTLLDLEKNGTEVFPSAENLKIIQDKGVQKLHYADNNLPTAPFELVSNETEWRSAMDSIPGEKVVVKSRKGGYDGKGVAIVSKKDILSGNPPFSFEEACLIEEFIDQAIELSVIVARNKSGEVVHYPIAEMVFDPISNLVDTLFSPANVSKEIEKTAIDISTKAIELMNGVGLFAVELFLTPSGKLYINEIAPRPHNSGHHTIEACYTSQYEQLLRVLLDLPLGSTELLSPAVMVNIVGDDSFTGEYQLAGLSDILGTKGVYIHLYDKKISKPNRKLGHITILDKRLEGALKKAEKIKSMISIMPK